MDPLMTFKQTADFEMRDIAVSPALRERTLGRIRSDRGRRSAVWRKAASVCACVLLLAAAVIWRASEGKPPAAGTDEPNRPSTMAAHEGGDAPADAAPFVSPVPDPVVPLLTPADGDAGADAELILGKGYRLPPYVPASYRLTGSAADTSSKTVVFTYSSPDAGASVYSITIKPAGGAAAGDKPPVVTEKPGRSAEWTYGGLHYRLSGGLDGRTMDKVAQSLFQSKEKR